MAGAMPRQVQEPQVQELPRVRTRGVTCPLAGLTESTAAASGSVFKAAPVRFTARPGRQQKPESHVRRDLWNRGLIGYLISTNS
jgi:hypothetical protein